MSDHNNIAPFSSTVTTVATSFTVTCRTLNLFENATFQVDTFDINNTFLNRQIVPITNEQYTAWNNNDEYIVQLMATILGFTLEPTK